MKSLNKADVNAALHTLWQAALGSGGLAIVADSASSHGIDLPVAEQGLLVVAASVVAALGSVVKAYVLQYRAGKAGPVAAVAADAVALGAQKAAAELAGAAAHLGNTHPVATPAGE